ncbi:MAG: hypothetical protein RB296_01265 [Acidobacteriota bacterium]|jgi:arabinofuranosyltransferase|nr:hypothetical protein [Acidobacteriota bacterium]
MIKSAQLIPDEQMKPYPASRMAIIVATAMIAVFAFFLLRAHIETGRQSGPVELNGFRSDFFAPQHTSHRSLYADDLGREKRFLAFARYVDLPAGRFVAEFHMGGSDDGSVQLEIAAQHGRRLLARRRVVPAGKTRLVFNLNRPMQIEPRVRFLSGKPIIRVERVRIVPLKLHLCWQRILTCTLIFGLLTVLLLLALDAAVCGYPNWQRWLGLLLFSAAFLLVISRAWISEDAFITLRHVDNLLHGYGPVYNPGERVEGYTHLLWLGIVSWFRATGLSAKGAVMLPSLLLTLFTLAIVLLRNGGVFRRDLEGCLWINPAIPLLLGTSGFIDFSTSGLETPLSFSLLALYAMLLRRKDIPAGPMGWLLALLVLTRPDFVVFAGIIFLHFLLSARYTGERLRVLSRMWLPPVVLLGIVQVWRMGYYAAWLPNPFYAKSGAGSHWPQGMAYLWDLLSGSAAFLIVVLAVAATLIALRRRAVDRGGRFLIVMSALLHGFFVVRGGGDFMHARFLLPALFLLSLASDFPVNVPRGIHSRKVVPAIVLVMILLMGLALQMTPVQTRGKSLYHFGISDERFSYYGKNFAPLEDLFQHRLLFIWRIMGQNYANLMRLIERPFTVAYANIGFLGYYAGPRVRVLDRLGLTDPVTARIRLRKRRRPGHEKSAPLAYLIKRQVTFASTPFSLWNRLANTPYGILWDLSPAMLHRLAPVLPADFKANLDREISIWLRNASEKELSACGNWLFFLSRQWVRYAPGKIRGEFNRRFDQNFMLRQSPAASWLQDHGRKVDSLLQRIQGPMSVRRFLSNLGWCLNHPAGLSFDPPRD